MIRALDKFMLAALGLAITLSWLVGGGDKMLQAIMPGGTSLESARPGRPQVSENPAYFFSMPDFATYRNVHEKKQQFFNFMLPLVREANRLIRNDRTELLAMQRQLLYGFSLDADQRRLLDAIAQRYRIDAADAGSDADRLSMLLTRIDIVPASLVLAQSANESGWGTSRFARNANNLFGVWCFTEGCGVKPRARPAGSTHEVARYDSVQESVNAYIHTINTHPAYAGLRALRAYLRVNGVQMSGTMLAGGLTKYSARGEAYVREIQQIIRFNNLQQYNLPSRT